jgi:hypothetical protein
MWLTPNIRLADARMRLSIDGGHGWRANRCFLAAEFPPKRCDRRVLIGRGRWGRSLSRWGHFSRDFVRNPSCRRYNRGVCFHLGSAGSTRGMTQRVGGPLRRSSPRVRTGTHQHTLMRWSVGFGRTAAVADGLLPLFGGPRLGGVSWRTNLADLFGGPRWRCRPWRPRLEPRRISDLRCDEHRVSDGVVWALAFGALRLALSDWRSHLAVSVGGPRWRTSLAVSPVAEWG